MTGRRGPRPHLEIRGRCSGVGGEIRAGVVIWQREGEARHAGSFTNRVRSRPAFRCGDSESEDRALLDEWPGPACSRSDSLLRSLPLPFPSLIIIITAMDANAYTLMVAGQSAGKTAFLRLLLDTADVALSATHDQLANLAKFVQGSANHTQHIRSVSVDVEHPDVHAHGETFTLTLVDTPSLETREEQMAERTIGDILRFVDSRFMESVEDVRILFATWLLGTS